MGKKEQDDLLVEVSPRLYVFTFLCPEDSVIRSGARRLEKTPAPHRSHSPAPSARTGAATGRVCHWPLRIAALDELVWVPLTISGRTSSASEDGAAAPGHPDVATPDTVRPAKFARGPRDLSLERYFGGAGVGSSGEIGQARCTESSGARMGKRRSSAGPSGPPLRHRGV